ncbi:MAG: hypothetical protein VX874_11445 [Pseudomonadota bacterium]|nr:hypothetical protein [Pseudomonadota bacterium]
MRKRQLYERISMHGFGPEGRHAFEALLGSQEHLGEREAALWVREYLRFIYLTQLTNAPLTPSVKVDVVWHLHLMQREDYWEHFCAGVLGKPLHHREATGAGEAKRHAEQYLHTLALYEQEFGEPPVTIWARKRARRYVSPLLIFGGGGFGLFFVGASVGNGPMIAAGFVALAVGVAVATKHRNKRRPASCSAACSGANCGGADCGGD